MFNYSGRPKTSLSCLPWNQRNAHHKMGELIIYPPHRCVLRLYPHSRCNWFFYPRSVCFLTKYSVCNILFISGVFFLLQFWPLPFPARGRHGSLASARDAVAAPGERENGTLRARRSHGWKEHTERRSMAAVCPHTVMASTLLLRRQQYSDFPKN